MLIYFKDIAFLWNFVLELSKRATRQRQIIQHCSWDNAVLKCSLFSHYKENHWSGCRSFLKFKWILCRKYFSFSSVKFFDTFKFFTLDVDYHKIQNIYSLYYRETRKTGLSCTETKLWTTLISSYDLATLAIVPLRR